MLEEAVITKLAEVCVESGVCPGEGVLSVGDIERIAKRTAEEVVARIRERERDSLLLNSIPYAYGSPGIVVDEEVAKATPCRCIEYRPGKKLCFSKGVVGALSDEQEKLYCPTEEKLESPGLQKRLEDWMESVDICKGEIAKIPPGERLKPWLSCMSRELKARGVEAYSKASPEVATSKEKMPRVNPHATAIQQDKQLVEQMKWLKAHGFKTPREAQEAGY